MDTIYQSVVQLRRKISLPNSLIFITRYNLLTRPVLRKQTKPGWLRLTRVCQQLLNSAPCPSPRVFSLKKKLPSASLKNVPEHLPKGRKRERKGSSDRWRRTVTKLAAQQRGEPQNVRGRLVNWALTTTWRSESAIQSNSAFFFIAKTCKGPRRTVNQDVSM